jgi:hypothetical protein
MFMKILMAFKTFLIICNIKFRQIQSSVLELKDGDVQRKRQTQFPPHPFGLCSPCEEGIVKIKRSRRILVEKLTDAPICTEPEAVSLCSQGSVTIS